MSLTVCEVIIPSARLGGESTLPSIYKMSNVQTLTRSAVDEDDGLFVGYGFIPSIFPYRMQEFYDRSEEPTAYVGVVLENEYLRALFLPELGGRLWSLYDKEKKRELLYENPVVRPCNLAVRNAWLAGGIEFNCGMVGHSPFTCSKIHAAEAELDDGTPVLRMYEYERIRGCVYQMDFFLPSTSRQLFARMRIVNPTTDVVPMYWWTNIALRENPEARDVIDADAAFNNRGGMVLKNPVPYDRGIDITYPSNNPVAIDYFWKIPDEARKYTAYIDREGYGFFQSSTKRLAGRKLFVWGQGEGGRRWQEFLTRDGTDGRYIEVQAGLARTQYECLPMPPKTAWEWLEAYGAVSADPKRIHGDFKDARREMAERLEELLPEGELEDLLKQTKKMATSPAKRQICYGTAWGTLEAIRRERCTEEPLCPHLDFGELTDGEKPWLELLTSGRLPKLGVAEAPSSWMLQREWTQLLEGAEPTHEHAIQLAAIYLATGRVSEAEEALLNANEESPTARFLHSQALRLKGDTLGAARAALEAHALLREDLALARRSLALAGKAGLHSEVISAYEKAPDSVRRDGRVSMTYAFALLGIGEVGRAEEVLMRDGGLSVTDIREGENSITELYIEIEKAKARAEGITLKAADVEVPQRFDFRMFVPKKNK